jgi:hypothetical protein
MIFPKSDYRRLLQLSAVVLSAAAEVKGQLWAHIMVCALGSKMGKRVTEKLVWPLCRYTVPEKCLKS